MALILVIDDEEDVRVVLQQVLEPAGHEVILAANGVSGLTMQRERPADLVITDILNSEKEGIETIRDLRQEFANVKIIAMSGGGTSPTTPDYLSTATELGADFVLRKPFEAGTLLKAVQQLLKVRIG